MTVATKQISWPGEGFDELYGRAVRLLQLPDRRRRILGIAGAPASGKSTLASKLTNRLRRDFPDRVAAVGMDAYHLAQRVLEEHGLAAIKGAPETFDGLGYLRLLERIQQTQETVYAPEFDRSIEDSIAHRVEITPETKLIITEGNYLCLDADPWRDVHAMLDETWFVELDEEVRRSRLVRRHERYGRSRSEAEERADGSDQRNAELIMKRRLDPDVLVLHQVGGRRAE